MKFSITLILQSVTLAGLVCGLSSCFESAPPGSDYLVDVGGPVRHKPDGGPFHAAPAIPDDVSYWDGDGVDGAPLIRINRKEQKASFYKGNLLVGVSRISSGKEDHGTPNGRYKITELDKDHRSSVYGQFKDKVTGQDLDLGFVGEVVAVDTEQIRWTLNQDKIPVIAPLGRDMNGCVYNINADMAACRIAGELQARKLVFLSDVPGILQNPKDEASLIPTIRRSAVNTMVSDGIVSGGMIPKVKSAIDALDMGTRKVHMIDGRLPHSLLLEIFTEKGIGTEILPE